MNPGSHPWITKILSISLLSRKKGTYLDSKRRLQSQGNSEYSVRLTGAVLLAKDTENMRANSVLPANDSTKNLAKILLSSL